MANANRRPDVVANDVRGQRQVFHLLRELHDLCSATPTFNSLQAKSDHLLEDGFDDLRRVVVVAELDRRRRLIEVEAERLERRERRHGHRQRGRSLERGALRQIDEHLARQKRSVATGNRTRITLRTSQVFGSQ